MHTRQQLRARTALADISLHSPECERARRRRPPGASSSLVKLFWSEMAQRMHETSLRMLGPDAMIEGGRRQRDHLYYRACTIFAGTSEIQRNTLGEQVLGLPREPRAKVAPCPSSRSSRARRPVSTIMFNRPSSSTRWIRLVEEFQSIVRRVDLEPRRAPSC